METAQQLYDEIDPKHDRLANCLRNEHEALEKVYESAGASTIATDVAEQIGEPDAAASHTLLTSDLARDHRAKKLDRKLAENDLRALHAKIKLLGIAATAAAI